MPSARSLKAGRAVIELSLLKGAVQKQLKQLQARVATIGKSFTKIGAPLLTMGGTVSAAFAAATKHFATSGDELSKLHDRTGLSVESLAELRYAAGQSDVSLSALARAARELQSKGLDPRAFDATLDRIAAIPDHTMRAQEAFKVFGKRTGAELLPLLGDLTALRQRARDLGLVMSAADAGAATKLGDTFDDVRQQFKRLVDLVGASVAGELTKLFEKTLSLGKIFIRWADSHRPLISMIAKVGAATAAAGALLISFGTSFAVLGFAIAGFSSAIGVAAAVLGALATPIGATVLGLTALTTWFATSTEAGRSMTSSLADWFGKLAGIARTTFRGIADSLMAGDIEAAAGVVWAGLRLAWLQGTNALMEKWREFKDFGVRTIVEMSFDIQGHFANMAAVLKKIWSGLITHSKSVGEQIGHWLTRSDDPELAAEQDRQSRDAVDRFKTEGINAWKEIDAQRDAQLKAIESARGEAQAFQSDRFNEEMEGASKAVQDARKRLDELSAAAKTAAEAQQVGKLFRGAKLSDLVSGGLEVANKVTGSKAPQALFDTRLAGLMFGSNPIDQQQLSVQKKMLRELQDKRGGLPVV